jgi:hypothetical protein
MYIVPAAVDRCRRNRSEAGRQPGTARQIEIDADEMIDRSMARH